MFGNQQSPVQLDEYVSRLGNIDPTVLEHVNQQGVVEPYMTVAGPALMEALVINVHTLQLAVDRVSGEIMNWGRIAAGCRRVWQVREREYRSWKAGKEIYFRKVAKEAGEKITEGVVEAMYRTDPDYGVVSSRVEAAEEGFNVADAIYRAFKVKSDLLQADVWRAQDGSIQRRSP